MADRRRTIVIERFWVKVTRAARDSDLVFLVLYMFGRHSYDR